MNTSNTHEEYLYELLESVAYEDLSPNDKALVDEQLGAENYRLQYQLLQATHTLNSEHKTAQPLALPKPAGRTIPLYQAVLAVAAVVTFFIMIWPHSETTVRTIYKVGPTQVSTNTIHDTIVQKIVKEKVIYKTNEENVLVDATPIVPEQTYTPQELVSEKIMSLKDDPIAQQFMAEMAKYEMR